MDIFGLAATQLTGIYNELLVVIGALMVLIFIPIGFFMVRRIIQIASPAPAEEAAFTPKQKRLEGQDPYDTMDLSKASIFNNNKGSWNDHAGDTSGPFSRGPL